MKYLRNSKQLVIGFVLGALFFSSISFAANTINLRANYGVKILQNSIDRTPLADDMKPFIANGRTFMSLRAVSELLGIEVEWDGSQRAVVLGEIIEGTPLPAPANVILGSRSNSVHGVKQFTTNGQSYGDKGFQVFSYGSNSPTVLEYNLNAQYSNLTVTIGIDDRVGYGETGGTRIIKFIGDNENILQSVTLGGGMVQENLNVNVTGQLKLKISIERGNYTNTFVNFINPILN